MENFLSFPEMKPSPNESSAAALRDLPNIGTEVARLLHAAGIRTPDELRQQGAVAAALRIRAIRPRDPPCRSMLSGLEGAIRGVRWHSLPNPERDALWEHYARRLSEKEP